jgi:tetratricopeptide (TPR) repeat protein
LKLSQHALGKKHPATAAIEWTWGREEIAAAKAQGRAPDARRHLEQAAKIWEAACGKEHPDLARIKGDLASLDNTPTTSGHGLIAYQQAIGMLEKSVGTDHPDVAKMLSGTAILCGRQEKWNEAKDYLERAAAIQKTLQKSLDRSLPDLAATLNTQAALLTRITPPDPDRAAELRTEAKAILAKHEEEEQGEGK